MTDDGRTDRQTTCNAQRGLPDGDAKTCSSILVMNTSGFIVSFNNYLIHLIRLMRQP